MTFHLRYAWLHFTLPVQDLYLTLFIFIMEPAADKDCFHPAHTFFNSHNTYVTEQNYLYGRHDTGRQQVCAGTRPCRC